MQRIDFHIHSCLSPCASLEMSPRAIAARALEVGLDAIALTDHNCAYNLPAFDAACREVGMSCLYGMEVTAAEEVHVLCLFDHLPDALDFGERIYSTLQDYPNDPDRFGDQPIVTVDGVIERFAEKLLIGATDISFFDLIPMALDAGALCIPAHVDRSGFSAMAHLGFIPDLPYSAVEVLSTIAPAEAAQWPVVRFSDSHALDQLGRRLTEIETDGFTTEALREALIRKFNQEPQV